MSGYSSKAEAESVVRRTVLDQAANQDLPTDPKRYNWAAINREVVHSRGVGYGWGIEFAAVAFWAAVRRNVRPPKPAPKPAPKPEPAVVRSVDVDSWR